MTIEYEPAGAMNGTNAIARSPGQWITGMGSQYPPFLYGHELLEEAANRNYDITNPSLVFRAYS